jgi:hypothetical protein
VTGRPRRRVLTAELGYAVERDPFTTVDPTLARHVAAEIDRIDPLPCVHDGGDLVDVTRLGAPPESEWLRACCGEVLTGEAAR